MYTLFKVLFPFVGILIDQINNLEKINKLEQTNNFQTPFMNLLDKRQQLLIKQEEEMERSLRLENISFVIKSLMNLRLLCLIFILCSFACIPHTNAQGWIWAKSAGGSGNEIAMATATDAGGNVYVTGSFSSATVTFGSFTLTNTAAGFTDIFLVKYDQNGNVVWASSAGGSDNDYATSLSLDAWGNIYVGGYFYSPTMPLGTTTLTNEIDSAESTCDLFVVKYNSSGNPTWAQRAGGTYNDQVNAVKADAAGNVVVTGNFESKYLIFGTDTITNPVPSASEVFVIKYDSSGTYLWANGTGGFQDNNAYAITTDAANNIFVAGYFSSPTISFGDTTLTNTGTGTDDIFLVKYNNSGIVQWARNANGANDDIATALGTDASGNIYLTGTFASTTLLFNTATLTNTGGNYDAFAAKYNTSGGVVWAKSIATGTTSNYTYSLALDDTANLIIAGNFGSGSITFGTSTITNSNTGYYDLFIAKYNSSGTSLWANTTGAGGSNANGVATDQSGDIYLTGAFSDSAFYFGSNELLNAVHTGSTDMFLAKYDLLLLKTVNVIAPAYALALYPNPAEDMINVTLNGAGYNNISVYDGMGRIIYQQQLTGNETTLKINTSNLADGVYFLHALHGDASENATFVIRK